VAATTVVGDDGKINISGEPVQRGTPKFAHLPAPLDAPLLQDDLHGRARRLSYPTHARVVGINGSPENWPAMVMIVVRDTKRLRGIGMAEMNKGITADLQVVL
jgi:hypothetical protein